MNPDRQQLAALSPQPPPLPNTGDVWAEVIADTPESDPLRPLFVARREMGKAKYGTYLGRDNGRDFRADAVQEGVDGVAYCRGARDVVGEFLFKTAIRWVMWGRL